MSRESLWPGGRGQRAWGAGWPPPRPIALHDPLCDALATLARQTWHHVATGFERRFNPAEPSFTDHNMIELTTRYATSASAIKFAEGRESETGADFEWWLGDGTAYGRFRVQAKKLDLKSDRYKHLYAKAAKDTTELQAERLERTSREKGFEPLHVFYNGWGPRPRPNDAVLAGGTGRGEVRPPDRCTQHDEHALRGCAIASTAELLRSRPTNEFAAVAPLTWPWSCLVCHAGPSDSRNPGLRVLHALYPDEDARTVAARLTTELPPVVAMLAGVETIARTENRGVLDLQSTDGPRTVLVMTSRTSGDDSPD